MMLLTCFAPFLVALSCNKLCVHLHVTTMNITKIQRFRLLRTAISKICNVSLSDDQWLQASLPEKSGGLGISRVSSLASSAFLASAVGTRDLQNQILRTDINHA